RPAEAPSALHHLICRVSFDTWRHADAPLLSSLAGPTWGNTQVNSGKSRTYGANVVRPIIEAKRKPAQTPARGANKSKKAGQDKTTVASRAKPRPRATAPARRVRPRLVAAPVADAVAEVVPAVRSVTVDAEFEGQRLDNFLL